ncbi:MAG TPA: hypothetical protein VJM31_09205 [Vicinamibacterales bacterium]|nr:hypothetical protein [Vicinamibacterales bacterium]
MYKPISLLLLGIVLSLSIGCAWFTRQASPSAGTGPAGATLTIGADGAIAPKTVTIRPGQVVQFVNKDSKEHLMFSNPHPVHSDCRPINAVGKLLPGESRNTANFEDVKTCAFHDHSDARNTALHGSITVAN